MLILIGSALCTAAACPIGVTLNASVEAADTAVVDPETDGDATTGVVAEVTCDCASGSAREDCAEAEDEVGMEVEEGEAEVEETAVLAGEEVGEADELGGEMGDDELAAGVEAEVDGLAGLALVSVINGPVAEVACGCATVEVTKPGVFELLIEEVATAGAGVATVLRFPAGAATPDCTILAVDKPAVLIGDTIVASVVPATAGAGIWPT